MLNCAAVTPRAKEGLLPQNILLIQDDPADAQAVRDALLSSSGGPFSVDWVRSCAEGLNRLALTGKQTGRPSPVGRRSHGVAAVLVDLYLPDSRGIETFDRLFQAAPQIPILVLIGASEEAIARLAVQRGAQDFLLKDRLDNYWLPKALRSMIERAANSEALYEEKERAEVTLNSIGDAVMCIDASGNLTYLNAVAEQLTGWSKAEAAGRALAEVFHIVDAVTRETLADPMALALRENKTVGLTPNTLLIRRDGVEAAIEDSAAPIHDRRGRVTGAVMVFHDVSTARAQSQRMSYLAQHDGLTDLANRILFNDRLAQAMSLAQRRQKKLALLFLDLDHFKHINDSLGHAIGDRLLQSAAKRLLDCVRSSDTVSRQGGDEFVILLSQVMHAEDAGISAEKILSAFNQPHHIGEHAIFVTASIGIVTYPDDAADAETLLKNADFAMYQAKDYGRNNYQFFKSDLNVTALERQAVEHELRHAVERGELILHYQPQINLTTGAIAGVEALLRWRHPLRGLLHPASFMSVAEESGWIVPIGRWALREGCRQAVAWQDAGLPPMRIAINVSAVELRAKDFVDGVRAVLRDTRLDPRYLELELTETYLMHDSTSTATVLEALKVMGVQLALDDFGTGYSSLSYMKRFPIDTLKIDRSFVHNLTTDSDDASIVSAVIHMGSSLHMLVVAEGVETSEQAELLRAQACPEAQGFYFSHPVVPRSIAQMLTRGARGARPARV
ncbi:MAG: putative bifunctional diguanylate cyclase/phosphodiesterase [Steroidobacteraceae bacterium]